MVFSWRKAIWGLDWMKGNCYYQHTLYQPNCSLVYRNGNGLEIVRTVFNYNNWKLTVLFPPNSAEWYTWQTMKWKEHGINLSQENYKKCHSRYSVFHLRSELATLWITEVLAHKPACLERQHPFWLTPRKVSEWLLKYVTNRWHGYLIFLILKQNMLQVIC